MVVELGAIPAGVATIQTPAAIHADVALGSVGRHAVGPPTSAALRGAGQWPTPEAQLDRLIAALSAAADDEERPDEERNRFRQAAGWLGGAASQVATAALGGAGGTWLSS